MTWYLIDMIMTNIDGLDDYEFIFHHIVCVLGYSYPVLYKQYLIESAMFALIGELSNPFINLKILFAYRKEHKTILATINDAIFSISFMFLRCYVGVKMVRIVCKLDHVILSYKMLPVMMLGLSLVWACEIVTGFFDAAAGLFKNSIT